LSDQSGPMSDSLVARSTSTDCGIAARSTSHLIGGGGGGGRDGGNPRRRVPSASSFAFGRLRRGAPFRSVGLGQRKGARTKIKFRVFPGFSNRFAVSVWDPRIREAGARSFPVRLVDLGEAVRALFGWQG
jgi:hypothetical protein